MAGRRPPRGRRWRATGVHDRRPQCGGGQVVDGPASGSGLLHPAGATGRVPRRQGAERLAAVVTEESQSAPGGQSSTLRGVSAEVTVEADAKEQRAPLHLPDDPESEAVLRQL